MGSENWLLSTETLIFEVLAFIINAPNFLRYFRLKKNNNNNKIHTLSQYTAMKISSKQM